jgi:hypothetical protein
MLLEGRLSPFFPLFPFPPGLIGISASWRRVAEEVLNHGTFLVQLVAVAWSGFGNWGRPPVCLFAHDCGSGGSSF